MRSWYSGVTLSILPLTLRAATTAPVKSRIGAPRQTVPRLRSSTSTA
jgi:hypothetical protein